MSGALLNQVKIVVVTRPAEDFPERDQKSVPENTQRLRDYGVEVRHKSGFHQKFTVIDGKIVWYGSVNFLSFGTAEESIMRFTSYDIAGQLIDTVLEWEMVKMFLPTGVALYLAVTLYQHDVGST